MVLTKRCHNLRCIASGSCLKARREILTSSLPIDTNLSKVLDVKSEITITSSFTELPSRTMASTTAGLIASNSGIMR